MPIDMSRRLVLGAAAGVAAGAALPATAQAAALSVAGLKVNGVDAPLGLDGDDIRLSWQIASAARGTMQVAYRIAVASSPARLGAPDLWDSGRIASDATFDIVYGGPALASRQRVWWSVTAWDNHGQSASSAPATWEMGLLALDDWSAGWIAMESPQMRADRRAGLPWLTTPIAAAGQARQFRLRFRLDSDTEVTLWTGSNAPHRALVDGVAIPVPPHSPLGMGRQGVVVTQMALKAGDHVLAVSVDDLSGFDALLSGTVRACLLVKAAGVHVSGRNAVASSQAPDGWATPGFDDRAWPRAEPVDGEAPWPGAGAFLGRRDFAVKARPVSARLYVAALGAADLYLNGKQVGDAALGPEATDTRKTVLYRTYDVTNLVGEGDNTLAAMVGDGWYGSYAGPRGRYPFGEAPLRLRGQLELTHADGSVLVVPTDEHWQLSLAPVTSSEIYDGEDYDARLEQPGWSAPGFAPSAGRWWPAEAGEAPKGRLTAAILPPIRRVDTLKPAAVRTIGDVQVIDFGQNFAGRARITVRGEAGRTVTLKFAEIVTKDGRADQSNLRAARAADLYTLKGDPAGETYEPAFTYHGFRYVEVSGLAAPLQPGDITGVVMHSDLSETGTLRIGNPIIQQLWHNTLWSQRSNFMGIPTDCPQRDERLGWMGDAHVFWDAASFNMDTSAFGEKWTRDIRDAQSASGAYTDVSPDTIGLGDATGASPGWAEAGVIVPWTVWKRFGDTAIIDQNWEAMERYLAFIRTNSDDFIWTRMRGSDFGDWLALDARQPGDPTTPKDLVATAMWKKSADAMVDMARSSGRGDAVAKYQGIAAHIKAAFAKTFVHADGAIGNGSQTGYILALRHDLVPDTLRAAAAQKLFDDIQRRGTVLSTGFLGTPASLDVIADTGRPSLVYDLLLRTQYPSWGYMVAKGATTIWERWNGDTGDVSMNSFNHYALGSVCGFVFRRIAGIDPVDAGFHTFRVDPVLDPRVATGGATFDARPGRIVTDWTLAAGGRLRLNLTVPANSRAVLRLPAGDRRQVRESGRALDDHPDVKVGEGAGGRLELYVGSGQYRFVTTPA